MKPPALKASQESRSGWDMVMWYSWLKVAGFLSFLVRVRTTSNPVPVMVTSMVHTFDFDHCVHFGWWFQVTLNVNTWTWDDYPQSTNLFLRVSNPPSRIRIFGWFARMRLHQCCAGDIDGPRESVNLS